MATDQGSVPWHRRTRRWGQANITELDPPRYDIAWWREHWRRTRVQGVIINAGGIVAYYPSRFPLHYRAEHLGDHDLFGELADVARHDGLVVLARMDSNRLHQQAYDELSVLCMAGAVEVLPELSLAHISPAEAVHRVPPAK